MKNRYLRAAVWMLTVLMVLGCLPLSAMAEGVVTDNSPALAAVDLLDGSRSVNIEGGGDGIEAVPDSSSGAGTTYKTNWTIPVYFYSEAVDGTLTRLTTASTTITKESSYHDRIFISDDVNNAIVHVPSDSAITDFLSQYNYSDARFLLGSSPTSGTKVNTITLSTAKGGGMTFNYGTVLPTDQYENNAIFVIIKFVPVVVTVSGNSVATLTSDYTTTYVESESAVTIKLPEQNQTINNNSDAYTITGWKDSTGTEYSFGQTVTVSKSTDFTPVVSELYTITFVQNEDEGGSGKRNVMYVASRSSLTFPELFAGWQVEGKKFVGWSTDIQGDGTGRTGVFAPNTQWMSSATSAVSVTSNTTFYAIWIEDTSTATHSAYFHIRLDGEIPFEPSNSKNESDYTASHGMEGSIRTTVSVNNNNELVAANVVNAPSYSEILTALHNKNKYTDITDAAVFERDYRVIWYVIKYDSHGDWHVDGIIVARDKYMVMYSPNGGSDAPPSHSESAGAKNIAIGFDPIPGRQGYKFLGWSEDPNATTPTYTKTGNNTMAEMPAHDVTLYAVWEADGNTPYNVEHYLQNADKTTYKLEKTETLKGNTDSLVSAVPGTFEGYSVDYSINGTLAAGTIAADGSLVLKLYYTRDTGSLTLKKVYEGIESTRGVEFVLSGFDSKDYGRAVQGGSKTIGSDGTVSIVVPANGEVTLTDIPTGTITVTEKGESGGKVTIDGKTFDVTGGGSVTVTKGGSATSTITNTLSTKSVDVTKIWSDNGNAYGTRPAQITVNLMNGTTVAGTVTVDAVKDADTQPITFSGVSIYDASGNEIAYTATEATVPGYESSASGLVITNTLKTYSLDVSKIVTGNFGDVNKEFSFTAKLLTGADAETTFTTGSFKNGTKSFSLKHGDKETLTGIPYGCKVVVTENDPSPYTVTNNSAEGAAETATIGAFGVMADDSAAVTFTNTYNVQIDTGVDLDTIPYVVMLLSIFGAGALWLIGRRRRTQN